MKTLNDLVSYIQSISACIIYTAKIAIICAIEFEITVLVYNRKIIADDHFGA